MIIGISGKINSGKDTVGYAILHHIARFKGFSTSNWPEKEDYNYLKETSGFEIKKFADKLKDITCLLIGCTRDQLEDREFKEKELGQEWTIQKMYDTGIEPMIETYQLTPRVILQLLGTECGRNIIHPNVWVNSLFNEYSLKASNWDVDGNTTVNEYPNWIITDMRFPNELEAVKNKGGITIRVNRSNNLLESNHLSETALDNAEFDYVIQNDGSIQDLIDKVKQILIKEQII